MQNADELRQQSQQVTNRANQAIAASEAASSRLRTGSGVRARPSSAPFLRGSSRLSPADQEHIASLEAQIADLQRSIEVSWNEHAALCTLPNHLLVCQCATKTMLAFDF